MMEKIASALQKKAYELFSVVHYEKKIEKDWQTQVLIDLEHFIHDRIAKIKNE
jgi:predicted alpha-1,6-mannanase (GH76 family)